MLNMSLVKHFVTDCSRSNLDVYCRTTSRWKFKYSQHTIQFRLVFSYSRRRKTNQPSSR